MKYNKPALTIEQQIEQLAARGLAIPDKARAAHYLAHLNYYRLRAYWLPFERDAKQHSFIDGANFEHALDFYVFDRKLRLLLLDAIERIEVSLRTQWAYHLAHQYGPHAYLDAQHFKDPTKHARSLAALSDEVERNDETFIRHYRNTYTDPAMPPIWAVCEILTLGQLSRWYENLAKPSDRQAIARTYRLDEKILISFFHHLSTVRNLCAHHSRLWNRRFVFTLTIPKHPTELSVYFNPAAPRNLYNTLVLIRYELAIISPGSLWEERLITLLQEHPAVDPRGIGFPEKWQVIDIWNDRNWKLPR
jgi:abortive infection bacteriophage resistance protein